MGISLFSSSYSRYTGNYLYSTDPDPEQFTIKSIQENNGYSLVTVVYPNCTNFEGTKLLLIADSAKNIQKQEVIDPHFLESNKIIARFRPDKKGKQLAFSLLQTL